MHLFVYIIFLHQFQGVNNLCRLLFSVPRYIIISFVCPSVHHDVRCGWYLKERFSHLGELVPFFNNALPSKQRNNTQKNG